MLFFDAYGHDADGNRHLLNTSDVLSTMRASIQKVLDKYFGHQNTQEQRAKKAIELIALWKDETLKEYKTDVVNFRTTFDLIKRKSFLRGGFEFDLVLAIMN